MDGKELYLNMKYDRENGMGLRHIAEKYNITLAEAWRCLYLVHPAEREEVDDNRRYMPDIWSKWDWIHARYGQPTEAELKARRELR